MSRQQLVFKGPKAALEEGYEAVAGPYDKGSERGMFERALAGFAGCDVVVVEQLRGLEIWRHGSELRDLYDEQAPGMGPVGRRGRVSAELHLLNGEGGVR